MYKLKETYLFFDGKDLDNPKLFISDSITHNTYIMESETREAFLEVLKNDKNSDEYYEVFEDYEFFEIL